MPVLKDDYTKTEKINGVFYNMSPSPGFEHGLINGNIYHSMRTQLKGSICTVSMENLDLHLSEDDYVIPDIMLICDRTQIKKNKYHGIPRLIVETLSPSTALKDKTVKMKAYAAIGVDEYWIISPKEKEIEIYYLDNGDYKLIDSYILERDKDDPSYNEDKYIPLKAMPTVKISLEEIFEGL